MARSPRVLLLGLVVLSAATLGACTTAASAAGPVAFPGAPSLPNGAVGSRFGSGPAPAFVGQAIVESAMTLAGVNYRFGGEDPATGVDCSGLVRFVFAQHQLAVPRTVAGQFAIGRSVGQRELGAGDLLFFSTIGPGATHVGIALGPSAPGQFVHAPGTGSVVRVERYDTRYWQDRFLGARRVL